MNTQPGASRTMDSHLEQALARSLHAVEDPVGLSLDSHEVLQQGRRARRRRNLGRTAAVIAPVLLLIAGGLWSTGTVPQSVYGVVPAAPWVCGPDSYPSSIGAGMPSARLALPGASSDLVVAVSSCGPDGAGWLLTGHAISTTDAVPVQAGTESSQEDPTPRPLVVPDARGGEVLAGVISRTATDLQAVGRPDAASIREPIPDTDLDAFAIAGAPASDLVALSWREGDSETLHVAWSQVLSRIGYGTDGDFETAHLWVAQDRTEQWWVVGTEVVGPFGDAPWATLTPGPPEGPTTMTAALLPADAENIALDAGSGATIRELVADENVTPDGVKVVAHAVTLPATKSNAPLTISWTDANGRNHETAVTQAGPAP